MIAGLRQHGPRRLSLVKVETMVEGLNGIGERLRDFRKKRGLTLQELALRTGLSASYLSQIENARANLTLDTLLSIANELNVNLAELFSDQNPNQVRVVRSDERRTYPLKDGGSEHLFFGSARTALQAAIIELPPYGTYSHFDTHPGDEFTYVLSGRAKILVGENQSYELDAGDIIYYRSTLPHRWDNISAEPLCMMVVNTPASF